ncbi:MAG: cytochrome c-type biogenesis protein CcmH [Burkholderiales bacterium]|nr:MAG: cytochrome c-type biogenesis protein CcmH [Burkholderiales bacterium]
MSPSRSAPGAGRIALTASGALRAALGALLLATSLAVPAQTRAAPSGVPPEQEEQLLRSDRFRHLATELRCLVCQNQTLADSNADLAIDLRNEVLRQMASGKDDAQIKSHLVDRYGEFVLYRPVLSARNLALWAGPAVLLALGAGVIFRMSRRPRAAAAVPSGEDVDARLARVDRLLDADEPGPR